MNLCNVPMMIIEFIFLLAVTVLLCGINDRADTINWNIG